MIPLTLTSTVKAFLSLWTGKQTPTVRKFGMHFWENQPILDFLSTKLRKGGNVQRH